MRVAVIGSRSFTDKQLLYETLDKINASFGAISLIVSGRARGATNFLSSMPRIRVSRQ